MILNYKFLLGTLLGSWEVAVDVEKLVRGLLLDQLRWLLRLSIGLRQLVHVIVALYCLNLGGVALYLLRLHLGLSVDLLELLLTLVNQLLLLLRGFALF